MKILRWVKPPNFPIETVRIAPIGYPPQKNRTTFLYFSVDVVRKPVMEKTGLREVMGRVSNRLEYHSWDSLAVKCRANYPRIISC